MAAPSGASEIVSLASGACSSAQASGAAAHQIIPASGAAVNQSIPACGAAAHPSAPSSIASGLTSPWAPVTASPQSVHPTWTAHDGVPPAGAASLPVGDLEEERENVDFLANQEDGVEEEESVEDDRGITEVAKVADKVVQAKDIF